MEEFDTDELCDFLGSTGNVSEEGVQNFKTNLISGSTFFDLDLADLKELLPLMGDRKAVQKLIASYRPTQQEIRSDQQI